MLPIITPRLQIRTAVPADAALIHALWTDPRVMRFVGFPQGLRTSRAQIIAQIEAQTGDAPWDRLLIVQLRDSQTPIGQCLMHAPDADGVAETDVKLLPAYWGHKYGVEVKQALVDALFTHTACRAVAGSPNVANLASIQMQEAVGGIKVGEGVHHFTKPMDVETTSVHYWLYHVRRVDWERRQKPEGQRAG